MHQNSTWLVSQTIAKGLSYGIILGSAIIKIPQIVKIMQKKSVFGISFGSTIFEVQVQ